MVSSMIASMTSNKSQQHVSRTSACVACDLHLFLTEEFFYKLRPANMHVTLHSDTMLRSYFRGSFSAFKQCTQHNTVELADS